MIIDTALILFQFLILYRITTSPIWAGSRSSLECVKVVYVSAGFAAIFTGAFAAVSMFWGPIRCLHPHVKFSILALNSLHSLIIYHMVHIFDRRRINIKRVKNAIPGSGNR